MKFDDFLVWLYKIGTGWLGWTPEITRAAHMQEIVLAYDGHVDKLKAIHGSEEKNTPKKGDKPTPNKNRVAPTEDNFKALFRRIKD